MVVGTIILKDSNGKRMAFFCCIRELEMVIYSGLRNREDIMELTLQQMRWLLSGMSIESTIRPVNVVSIILITSV